MWLRDLLAFLPTPKGGRNGTYDPWQSSGIKLAEPTLSFEAIPERFVHDIWSRRLFDTTALSTSDGVPVQILDSGQQNHNDGPDFSGAHLQLGDTQWRGDVEIHVRSSDWVAHKHEDDEAYNSVVLHVVLSPDIWTSRLRRPDGSHMPELVLLRYLGQPLRRLLRELRINRPDDDIACAAQIASVPRHLLDGWVHKLGLERIDEKVSAMRIDLASQPDEEAVLYEAVFRALGYAKNGEQMAELSRRVPLSLLRPHDQRGREAILFYAAGFLTSGKGELAYVNTLRREFLRLSETTPELSSLVPMRRVEWSFFRLRPANFPTIRIAQGAALVRRGKLLSEGVHIRLTRTLTDPSPYRTLGGYLRARPDEFWENHVRLDRPARPRSAQVGEERIRQVVSNAVLPYILAYAGRTQRAATRSRVLRIYEQIAIERNEIVRKFIAYGVPVTSLVASQGVHQLYRTRCQKGGCLSCVVGRHLLANSRTKKPEDSAVG